MCCVWYLYYPVLRCQPLPHRYCTAKPSKRCRPHRNPFLCIRRSANSPHNTSTCPRFGGLAHLVERSLRINISERARGTGFDSQVLQAFLFAPVILYLGTSGSGFWSSTGEHIETPPQMVVNGVPYLPAPIFSPSTYTLEH